MATKRSSVKSDTTPKEHKHGNYAKVNGTRLYYRVEGAGYPLVLIHGYSLDTRMWDAQMPALTPHYQVIRYDRRGFGKSGVDQTGFTDAEDLDALLSHLQVESCIVWGMSQGGGAAVHLTLDHPEMVAALILQDTKPEGFRWPRNPFGERKSLMEIARTNGLHKAKKEWLANPRFEISRTKPKVFNKIRQIVTEWSGARLLQPPIRPLNPPGQKVIDRLLEINVATLVIVGEFESQTMHCAADALAYGIRNAKKVVIAGAGHMANMDEPEPVNKAVLHFLSNVIK